MEYRSIQVEDLPRCAEVFASVFNRDPWNENWTEAAVLIRLQEIFDTPGFQGVLTLQQEEVIGFALGSIERWDQEKHFNLKEMCVKTDHQRSGIGKALMNTLEDRLTELEVGKIYLQTLRGSSAEEFYEKCGFYVSTKVIMMGKYLKN